MSQIQRLPDPVNLSPTVQPIDTYFRPTEQQVAGAPIGPNPARQIAQALGQFNEATQKFYFEPAHQQMIRQQQVDAQVYHSRLENFKSFDEAVKSGAIHQGDNPWLQSFTKELYAKDAVNELSVRAAEFTDRQDILSGEYGETGDATASFNLAFQEAKQQILEKQGGTDPYLNMVFNQLSEPVRARAANQFAQGLRRHNVDTALMALEKDINNTLTSGLEGFAGADAEAKGRMIQELSEATKALAVESNLLSKQQVNATIGRAILGYVDGLVEDHPRTAATLLDMFDDIETSPGSYLRDGTAFNLQVTRLEDRIADRLVEESDDAYKKRRQRADSKSRDLAAEVNKKLADIEDFKGYRDGPEVAEYEAYLVETYGDDVDSPVEYFRRRLNAFVDADGRRTSEAAQEELEENFLALKSGAITPKAAEEWLHSSTDLSVADIHNFQKAIDTKRSDGQALDAFTYNRMQLSLRSREQEALQAFGDEVLNTSTGETSLGKGPEYRSKMSGIELDLGLALADLELSEEYQSLTTNQQKAEAIDEVVEKVFDLHLPSVDEPVKEIPSDRSLQELRLHATDTRTSRAYSKVQGIRQELEANTQPNLAKGLREKLATAEDELKAAARSPYDRLNSSVNSLTDTVTDSRGRRYPGKLRHSPQQIAKDLHEISMASQDGARHARVYLYNIYRKSIPPEGATLDQLHEARQYKSLLASINPKDIRLVDSPQWTEDQYEEYLEISKNSELLDEVEPVTVTWNGITLTIKTYPYRENLFYQMEQIYGADYTNPDGSKLQQLQQSWANLLAPPQQPNQ